MIVDSLSRKADVVFMMGLYLKISAWFIRRVYFIVVVLGDASITNWIGIFL
jgi:hypothetical protein